MSSKWFKYVYFVPVYDSFIFSHLLVSIDLFVSIEISPKTGNVFNSKNYPNTHYNNPFDFRNSNTVSVF